MNKFSAMILGKIIGEEFENDDFPLNPTARWKIDLRLEQLLQELEEREPGRFIGEPYQLPHPYAVRVWQKFLQQNPNHLGNWSEQNTKHHLSYHFEQNLIFKIISLLNSKASETEGYVTTGATEGNIFSSWLGRNHLAKYVHKDKICLLRTDLTHFSLRKAADVTGVPDFITPLDDKQWNISLTGLERTVGKLYRSGYRGFLLPLTLGYTISGTNDDYAKIEEVINEIEGKYPQIRFFVWMDAAFSGLILPLFIKRFKPFASRLIQTYILDLHKFPGTPYPSGIIIYRRKLRSFMETDIPYLFDRKDSTLVGTRSGVPAIAMWALVQSLGKSGLIRIINECLKQKSKVLKDITRSCQDVTVITDPLSLQAALVVRKPLPVSVTKKFGIRLIKYPLRIINQGVKEVKLYKLFFLPIFS